MSDTQFAPFGIQPTGEMDKCWITQLTQPNLREG